MHFIFAAIFVNKNDKLHEKNDFAKVFKNLNTDLNTDLKIIMLDQNNYVRCEA